MRRLRALLSRFAATFRKERSEREFAREMQSHLELHIEENLRAGMTTQEARRQALLKLGGVEQTKELYRDRRSLPLFESFFQDVRVGARALLKERAVSLICILVLALGIGASTALYSVWRSALVFPYDFENNGRWVVLLAGFNRQQTRSWFL